MNRLSTLFSSELKEIGKEDFVKALNAYVGDIHNHCGISYGYGSDEKAIKFASQQLDFFSVTGHFAWPDMETAEGMQIPADVIAYHKKGFAKLRENWPTFKMNMKNAESKVLIPFLSYEYHSFYYGDYTILCRSLDEDLPAPVAEGDVDTRLTDLLKGKRDQTERFLCTPHHIGYKQGYRGINWDEFQEEASPLVEIASMHGCAESHDAKLRYLHTMGPRSRKNTYQGGLKQHHHFGVVGSTDHHNASPGSYGFGRTVLFAPELTRDSIWNTLRDRFTTAATGDPIQAMLFVDGNRMGLKALEEKKSHRIDAFVSAFDELESVEVVQGDKVILGQYTFPAENKNRGFVSLAFGWGKKHKPCIWDVKVEVENGTALSSTPRLRGIDMVDPLDAPKEDDSTLPVFTRKDNGFDLHAYTDGNPTAATDTSQAVVLEVEGDENTKILVHVKASWAGVSVDNTYTYTLKELENEQATEYLSGFVSPAFALSRFAPLDSTLCHISADVELDDNTGIYLRAYEKNGDGVYTSPVSFI